MDKSVAYWTGCVSGLVDVTVPPEALAQANASVPFEARFLADADCRTGVEVALPLILLRTVDVPLTSRRDDLELIGLLLPTCWRNPPEPPS